MHALRTGELVRIRKKVTFERRRLRRKVRNQARVRCCNLHEILRRTQTGVVDCGRNIEHVEAFGNHYCVKVDVPVSQAVMNCYRACAVFKKIFAGFERSPSMEGMPKHKSMCIADYAGRLEFTRHSPGRVSLMQQDEFLPSRGERPPQSPA